MRSIAVLFILICAACAPVDPYSQRAQADGFIAGTQAAQNSRATDAAILQAAQVTGAAQEIAFLQQAGQSTAQAQAAQMTQIYITGLGATATVEAWYPTATMQAQRTQAAGTATAYPPTATAQAKAQAVAQTKAGLAQASIIVLLVAFVTSFGFVLRQSGPIIAALAKNIAQQITARSMLRDTPAGVMVFVRLVDGGDGLYVPSNQVLDYARLMLPAERTNVVDYQDEPEEETPPVYWHIRQILQATIDKGAQRGYRPHQLAAHPVARLGGPTWTTAIETLQAVGVKIEVIPNQGTYLRDPRYPTAAALLQAIYNREIIIPSPTGEMGQIYAQNGAERVKG